MSWLRRNKLPAPELPSVYIWQQYTPGGYTMRFFVPNKDSDLTRIPGFGVAVRKQLDEERFGIPNVRQYTAYVAIQWLWTPLVDSREKVEQGLRDAEERVLKLLVEPAGWITVPLVAYFLSQQDVARVARERGMGTMWMLGAS